MKRKVTQYRFPVNGIIINEKNYAFYSFKEIYNQRHKGDEKMTGRQLDLCICEIAKGNREALRQLYDEMKNPIYLFALSLVKDYQLAEDVQEETFLAVMQSARNYKGGTNPKAWIFSIARNCCMDSIKANSKCICVDDETLASFSKKEDERKKTENTVIVMEALSSLSEDERMIVSLYMFSGLKQTEIAKVLGMSYLSVRSKYGYAIKKLKRYFKEKGVFADETP